MIRASELPTPLAHAFLDALEAWGELEHELFMTWQYLRRSPDFGQAWADFSRMSTEHQRKSTVKLVREHLTRQSSATPVPQVFGRLPDLTKKRDRIIHGRWRKIELVDERDRPLGAEYLRLYDARGEPSLPRNEQHEQSMLGRSRFYENDLRAAQRQFMEAARDIMWARADIVTGVV